MIALEFIRKHWKPLAGLALVLVAFAAGRFTIHPKVETRTVEVYRDRVVKEQVKSETSEHDRVRVVYRDRTVIQHPDGTVEHRDVERTTDGDKDKSGTVTTRRDTATKSSERSTVKTVSSSPPAWVVGASLGVPVNLNPVGIGTPFVIVHVDRHVVGPVWLGVWGSLDVHGHNPAAGVSLGVSF